MFVWTEKRRAFLEHYLRHFNGARAARDAGYSVRSCHAIQNELLKMPEMRAAIEAELDALTMPKGEILKRLTDQARADIGQFMRVNELGHIVVDFEELKRSGYLVKEVYNTPAGIRIVLHDQQKALELLGKSRRLFTDKIVEVEHLNVEGLDAALEKVYGKSQSG